MIVGRHHPLQGVGDDAAEWTADRLQALILEFNRLGLRWLRTQQFAQENQALATMGGNLPAAAIMGTFAGQANTYRLAVIKRRDWVYELANLFDLDRWDDVGPHLEAARRLALVQSQGLGGLPLVPAAVAVLAALLAWLRWCSLEAEKLEAKLEVDTRRLGLAQWYAEQSKNPAVAPQIRDRMADMSNTIVEANAGRTADLGRDRDKDSSVGSLLLWGALGWLAWKLGPSLVGAARGR